MNPKYCAALLVAALPLTTPAAPRSDLGRELDQARAELRVELARERSQLDHQNLSLGDSIRVGKSRRHDAADRSVPNGEITPDGDLLVDGKAVAIDIGQRRALLGYRARVIELAKAGIDAGEAAAMLAIDATDVSMFQLIVGGLTGSLERRVEGIVERELQPAVLGICRRLPGLRDSQQALAASLPAFRPYATLRNEDIADCEADVRRDLASR